MDVASLKSQLKAKNIPSFLIFCGDEWEVQKIYIQQISKIMGLEQRRVDSVMDIVGVLRNKSFMSKKYLYIVRDDREFTSSEKLQNKIESMLGNNILIFMCTKLDKRLKFYNKYKDVVVEFEALSEPILRKYIQKKIPLTDRYCDKLIEVCENNYGRILLEIDKIKMYSENRLESSGIRWDDVLCYLIDDGIIFTPPKDAIFDLIEAILRRDVKQSFELLRESYASGEATMVMLLVLFNNAKAVLQVQTCRSREVSKATGLTGWQIMNANKVKGHYKENELIDMLHLIRQLETGIKTGKIEDKFVMDYLLVSVL